MWPIKEKKTDSYGSLININTSNSNNAIATLNFDPTIFTLCGYVTNITRV